MQRYLNQNTFKEKIFRLRVNEESYNVIICLLFPITFFVFLGCDNDENHMCVR